MKHASEVCRYAVSERRQYPLFRNHQLKYMHVALVFIHVFQNCATAPEHTVLHIGVETSGGEVGHGNLDSHDI